MEYQLYGFILNEEIFFDIKAARMFRLPTNKTETVIIFCGVFFNRTMLNLFTYLLVHARKQCVSRDELLYNIWEKNELSASTQRLCKVINNLNEKLNALGLSEKAIVSVKGHGYILRLDSAQALYSVVNE
ncbi:TPA: helix-turn-helix domain-containing protein [Salmonella enterica subsp. salamae serovar 28:r:e,n,z15]|nr:helix-turn-helix domain-containing protein [Salmonella enterica]HCM1914981.1 helix-turn-helix domain-containing protein [Salmonella enterica subsp. salamae serovar 28:r:e,n,z15]